MRGEFVSCGELDAPARAEMLALLRRHFEGVDRAQFERDLAEKHWVVTVRDGTERLVGFSTLRVERLAWHDAPFMVVHSGDTIMAPEAWQSPILSRTWIDSVRRIHAGEAHGRCLWLLLVSGFRTYRFLSVFWREFFPRFDATTPERTRALIRDLATARYGSAYEPSAGIVRFARPQVLRGALRAVPPERRRDPHVDFFLAANPGHERGDELVCLAELADWNLTPAGRRMVGDGVLAGRCP